MTILLPQKSTCPLNKNTGWKTIYFPFDMALGARLEVPKLVKCWSSPARWCVSVLGDLYSNIWVCFLAISRIFGLVKHDLWVIWDEDSSPIGKRFASPNDWVSWNQLVGSHWLQQQMVMFCWHGERSIVSVQLENPVRISLYIWWALSFTSLYLAWNHNKDANQYT